MMRDADPQIVHGRRNGIAVYDQQVLEISREQVDRAPREEWHVQAVDAIEDVMMEQAFRISLERSRLKVQGCEEVERHAKRADQAESLQLRRFSGVNEDDGDERDESRGIEGIDACAIDRCGGAANVPR